MAKCTCVWDCNRLTKPRFPSCSSWHLDSGWSDSHCSVNGQYQGVQAGLGVCTVSRSQGHQLSFVRMRFAGCSSTTSDKLFELNGQEHCASSTRSVHLKHEESELWDISILFSGAEPSTGARNADLCTKQTEGPEVNLNNTKPSGIRAEPAEQQFCIDLHKEDREIESGVVWGLFFRGVGSICSSPSVDIDLRSFLQNQPCFLMS